MIKHYPRILASEEEATTTTTTTCTGQIAELYEGHKNGNSHILLAYGSDHPDVMQWSQ